MTTPATETVAGVLIWSYQRDHAVLGLRLIVLAPPLGELSRVARLRGRPYFL